MKIAILLMIHKINDQVNNLIKTFDKDKFDIFIHIDKKVTDLTEIYRDENIFILEDRISVMWATVDVAHAHIKLLKAAYEMNEYLHYTLISGQDLPIKPTNELYKELINHKDISYININTDKEWINKTEINVNLKYPRFMIKRNNFSRIIKKIYQAIFGSMIRSKYRVNYFGSQWMSLTHEFVDYLFYNYNVETELLKEYKYSICVDETMIHTLFMNSRFKELRRDNLTYVDWSEGNSSPKTLTLNDYKKIKISNKFFARKFDENIDKEIITKILDDIREKGKQQ